ncbi:AraC family ligand binding domain-containing protein [Holdemania filiformis]|uniref:AraC family ligand binding domain-containing protein n=1 Tax=Holdemania filiformis TaxID=61171 RepID=UPI002431EDA5|nr:AraC family ligand binding domain-containing protein [Holdemania filiformis]
MFTSNYTIYKVTQRANTYLNHFYNNIEPHYKILFVTSGGCNVVIHHCQFQVQAGDCILIPPYVIHSAVFSKINSIELVEVQFNCVSTTDELLLNSRIQDHYCFKIKEFETFLFFHPQRLRSPYPYGKQRSSLRRNLFDRQGSFSAVQPGSH